MPSFPDNERSCNSNTAVLVAINIVTQVLNEAEDILNAVHDSGQPWRYVWRQKKGNGEIYENAKNFGILGLKVDDISNNNSEIDQNNNVIVTSTPQKELNYIPRTYNENSFIGQGDEDIQKRNTEFRSPSMLINCLFDMSEVEKTQTIEIYDDIEVYPDAQDLIASTVAKLVESYVNLALNIVSGAVEFPKSQGMAESIEDSRNSSYSFLTDAVMSDHTENDNATFFIDNIKLDEDKDQCTIKPVCDEDLQEITKKDIELYEKTFLTLNRDYDKHLEEDFPPEGRSFTMQEVELTTHQSSENVSSLSDPQHILTTNEEPSVAAKVPNKNGLVKRCRLQGAKLMSRLRSWWWKQRLIGKRKGSRSGICPQSPKAWNLATILLDHRKLRSPSPRRATAWKFNTVNNALIHSYNMNVYEFKINSTDPVERD